MRGKRSCVELLMFASILVGPIGCAAGGQPQPLDTTPVPSFDTFGLNKARASCVADMVARQVSAAANRQRLRQAELQRRESDQEWKQLRDWSETVTALGAASAARRFYVQSKGTENETAAAQELERTSAFALASARGVAVALARDGQSVSIDEGRLVWFARDAAGYFRAVQEGDVPGQRSKLADLANRQEEDVELPVMYWTEFNDLYDDTATQCPSLFDSQS